MRRDRRGRLWARDGRAMQRPCWRVILGTHGLYEGQVQIGGQWRYCDCAYRCRKCGACLGCERELVIDASTGDVDLEAARCVEGAWHEAEMERGPEERADVASPTLGTLLGLSDRWMEASSVAGTVFAQQEAIAQWAAGAIAEFGKALEERRA